MSAPAQDFDSLRQQHQGLRQRCNRLEGVRQVHDEEARDNQERLADLDRELEVGRQVGEALDKLSEQAYEALLQRVARLLSSALREVLGQELVVTSQVSYAHGATTVTFGICRDGREEHLLHGQGGSVANVVCTGLRVLALACLPADRHRRFLVLDEQDCWLQPAIVSRLVQVVHSAAEQLGFQVLMISHHDLEHFEQYADSVYELVPVLEGVQLCPRRAGLGGGPP
jgi:hypothetical protein